MTAKTATKPASTKPASTKPASTKPASTKPASTKTAKTAQQGFVIPVAVSTAIGFCTDRANGASVECSSQYRDTADFLLNLFKTGNETGIHLTLVNAQDRCKGAPAWNVYRAGITSALKTRGLLIKTARNIATSKGAFTLQTKDAAKAIKQAEKLEQDELAARSEAENAMAKAAARASITPADVCHTFIATCESLGFSAVKTAAILNRMLAKTATAKTATAKTATAKTATARTATARTATAKTEAVETV